MRTAEIKRKTTETDIQLSLDLDGGGESRIDSGCPFMDHMLTLFARHGNFGLSLSCAGDTAVDYHHSVEDIGICLGAAFKKALGDMAGINRYGFMILPMDEALILTAVDISGRSVLEYDLPLPAAKVGDFDTELVREFFTAFTRSAAVTLHVRRMAGENTHHLIEGAFKSFARSMKQAVALDGTGDGAIPSTKGVIG